jgi:hypothetical protein
VIIPYSLEGSAKNGEDYTVPPGPFVIRAGGLTASKKIALIDDSSREGDEEINIVIGSPIHSVRGERDVETVTIRDNDRIPRIAVVPFLNRSERKNAGEIVMLHFVNAFFERKDLFVIDPGGVRENLLDLRIIMRGGVSFNNAEVVAKSMHANIILAGEVFDYTDVLGTYGTPVVDFSVFLIDPQSRKIIWSSRSRNKGDDGVFFFDRGMVNSAGEMASQMSRLIVKNLMKQ